MEVYDAAGRPVRPDSGESSNNFSIERYLNRQLRKRPKRSLGGGDPDSVLKKARLPNYKSQGVPPLSGANIQYSDGVVDIASNTTASVPLMQRPYQSGYHKHYVAGSPLFVHRSETSHLSTIADIPTLNYFLRLFKHTNGVNKFKKLYENLGSTPTIKAEWGFQGVLRNASGLNLQRLLNIDVFGRSKVANLFGKVKTGDVVGFELEPVDLQKLLHMEPNGAPSSTRFYNTNGDGKTDHWQLKGKKLEEADPDSPFKFLTLGIVCNAMGAARDSPSQRERAHFCSHDLASLPQIEVLLG